MPMTRIPVFVGIDVSKAQLDVALRPEGCLAAPNDEAGIATIVSHLRAVTPTLARRLREDGAQGFLVKPVQSQELALALLPYVRGGQRNYP